MSSRTNSGSRTSPGEGRSVTLKFSCHTHSNVAVSFDLFGTLVSVDRTDDPATAIAHELEERGVSVTNDWDDRYRRPTVDAPAGAEIPLPAHVSRALADAGVEWEGNVVRRAVIAAFDPVVETRDGAREALEAAKSYGPVALCSNCSVPELVGRTLIRSDLSRTDFDVIVSSVACGWRKPAPEIFQITATQLEVPVSSLIHVGDDPRTDGGITAIGGTAILLSETPLEAVPSRLEAIHASPASDHTEEPSEGDHR